jgi:hypothetical protein
VCWFKSSAREHLAKIHEIICILEQHGLFVTTYKKRRPGYIVFEDEYQVVAEPVSDLNL